VLKQQTMHVMAVLVTAIHDFLVSAK
jgi:hypothetical protein